MRKYSIIIPHYNDINGLKRLLKTIPNREDIEVIIVDDNSNCDHNDLYSVACSNKCIKVFFNKSGIKGAGSCRNLGIKNSSATYVIFADADDLFTVNAFSIIDKRISISKAEIIYFTPTSLCLISGGLSDRHEFYEKLVNKYIYDNDELIRYKFSVPWSKVYKRDFLISHEILFDEVIASNDVMFSLKSGHKAKMIDVYNDIVYCVTRGTSSLTVNFSREVSQSRLLVSLNESEYLNKNNINVDKIAVISLLKRFIKHLNIKLLFKILESYFRGDIVFFPVKYTDLINKKLRLNNVFSKPRK